MQKSRKNKFAVNNFNSDAVIVEFYAIKSFKTAKFLQFFNRRHFIGDFNLFNNGF